MRPSGPERPTALTAAAVHEAHADFVWACLRRLGVPREARADAMQEVFLVVHRRVADFDGRSLVTTWLYGICRRVAADRRRTQRRRPEAPAPEPLDPATEPDQEGGVSRAEAREEVQRALAALDLDHRAVFVMFELDELPCGEIAQVMGVPVGTVYSRLHAARARFAEVVRKERRRRDA